MADFFNERRFRFAVASPGGPELQQNNFAFGRSVGKSFAVCGSGVEARGGLLLFGVGVQPDGGPGCDSRNSAGQQEIAHEVGSREHGGNIA